MPQEKYMQVVDKHIKSCSTSSVCQGIVNRNNSEIQLHTCWNGQNPQSNNPKCGRECGTTGTLIHFSGNETWSSIWKSFYITLKN
jgi:hypothetical protein